MSTKQRLLHDGLEERISNYGSQDDHADPEVGPSTLRVPWVTKVIVVGCLGVLRSTASIATAMVSVVRTVHSEVTKSYTLLLILANPDHLSLHRLYNLLEVVEKVQNASCVNEYHEHLART